MVTVWHARTAYNGRVCEVTEPTMFEIAPLLLIVAALLARVGQVLIAFSAGRARSAGTSAFVVLLDLALAVVVVTLLFRMGVYGPSAQTSLLPVVGTLLAGGLLTAVIAERATLAASMATSLLFSAVVAPLSLRVFLAVNPSEPGHLTLILPFFPAAGLLGLIAALLVGPRDGRFHRDGSVSVIPSHQFPLLPVGFLLLFTALLLADASLAGGLQRPTNLVVGVASGVLATAAFTRWRFGKLDPLLTLSGGLSALVAASVGMTLSRHADLQAIALGGLAGLISTWLLLRLERRLRLDDVPAATMAYLSAPVVGLAGASLFSVSLAATTRPLLATLMTLLFPVLVGVPVYVVLRRLIPLRIREEQEYEGQDLSTLDLNAYPDFSQPMIRSSHTREI